MIRQDALERRGLTLLELILALGLSVVLLFAVAMAMQTYWKAFDVKRTNVEQSHLGRAILRYMEDDIRSAVQYTPVDLTGLDSMTGTASSVASLASSAADAATSQSGPGSAKTGDQGSSGTQSQGNQTGQQQPGGTGGAAQPTSQTQPGGAGGSSTFGSSGTSANQGGSTQSGGTSFSSGTPSSGATIAGSTSGQKGMADSAAATESTEGVPAAVVGLYGSATQLQFDVSRLPRVDQYETVGAANMVQIPSDIKTVTYYVRSEQSTGGSGQSGSQIGASEPSTTGEGRGLMRLEMDRAVSAYEESNGTLSAGYDGAKLLAEEVTSVQFRYWDGMAWVEDWNSDEMGGLPLAIEIVLTMGEAGATEASAPQPLGAAAALPVDGTAVPYRMVVHLPTASPQPPTEEPATDSATTDAAAAGSTTTGSAATGSAATGSTKGATP